MKNLCIILITIVLLFFGILSILIYWNNHLYYEANKTDDNEGKIKILKRSIDFYPSNDLVFYELGKAYFNLGVNNIGVKDQSVDYLRKSIESFNRAIKSNPASYISHFNLAQSLLYMGYLFPSTGLSSHDEFKKAVTLAGDNSQIFYEVANIFFSRWAQLSNEDKDFTIEISRKIMQKKSEKIIRALLYNWEMNIKNFDIMKKILPVDPRIYRIYAEFLGEKSLSLEERQESLAKAEFLEFKIAKEEYLRGEQAFYSFRMEEAFNHFNSCLKIMKKIKFYHNFAPDNMIDLSEYVTLRKNALLNSAKCLIEQGRELKEIKIYLHDYLNLEDEISAISDFESYLTNKELISGKMDDVFNDMDRLSLQLKLCAMKNQYGEVMRIGRLLRQSFIVIPKGKEESYVQILHILGDSYQRSGYLYDADEFYQKALEIDPDNLETLKKIYRNYERLGADEKLQITEEKIEAIISPKEKIFGDLLIDKGKSFTHTLVLGEWKTILEFQFDQIDEESSALISIDFNGRIIWENYLNNRFISVPVESNIGINLLSITSINRPISLAKLSYNTY